MNLKFTYLPFLLPVLVFAKTPHQLHYSRDLGDDISFVAIVTPKKLLLHIDDEPSITKEIQLTREEFLKLCEYGKAILTKSLIAEDFTNEDDLLEGDTRVIMFSGSSVYALDWKYDPESVNELESHLLQKGSVSTITELRTQIEPIKAE